MAERESHQATEIGEQAPEGRAPAAMVVPDRVGRYVVLRQLGAGAMGIVVAAYDPELDRQLAIKLISPRVAAREDARQRMLREAKGLARLSHPNVVQVYDAGTVDGRVFIAMELVDGRPLSSWVEGEGGERRSVDEILAVHVEAGRGLAAAHAAGLVHRDFKPDNVLVDREGRARVLDFGLVRASEADDGPATGAGAGLVGADPPRGEGASSASSIATEPTLEVSLADSAAVLTAREQERSGAFGSHDSELSLELTHGGQIMGTPAYMSLEQWKGAKADARSDQFSFCVALWEALYGERPFYGRTMAAIVAALSAGTIVEPERPLRLPRRIRAALERGLRGDPSARFESMDALLRELAREDWSGRSLPLAALALAAFGVLAWGRFVGTEGPAAPSCDDAAQAMAGVWSDARREELRASFEGTGLPVEAMLTQLGADLDDYAGRWRAAANDNCAATWIRKQQPEDVLDQRARCLDAKLAELDALVEVLTRADEATVDQALFAVESLPSLAACEAEHVGELGEPLPDDAELAARVIELRQLLAGVDASLDTGRFDEAAERIEPLAAQVEAVDYAPLTAAFALERGRLLRRIDRWDEAGVELQRAYFLAARAGDDVLALRAATWLAELEGTQHQRPELARLWERQAEALLARQAGRFPELAADLADTRSWNAYLRDDLDGARAVASEGLALLDAAQLDAPMHRLALLLDRGGAEYGAGDLAASEASFEAALALAEATVGRDNPKATGALNNLAVTYSAEGDYEGARALLRESVAIRERALGPDNTLVGVGLSNLADIELERGDGASALEAAERGHQVLLAGAGPDRIVTVLARQRLGRARVMTGAADEGALDLGEALAVAEAPPDPDASLALELRADLVVALAAAGRHAESLSELARVRADELGLWRELVSAGRFAAKLGQAELADELISLALVRVGEVDDAGSRRSLALARLDLAASLIDRDPERAAATLIDELDADLSGAPVLLAELARLRSKLATRPPDLTDAG